MDEKNQALIETAADARNQEEIDQLQANETRPPYELWAVSGICVAGGIMITLVLLFADGNDRAIFAGIISTFMLATGMPLIGKINQATHNVVNARLGEERREKREAARNAAKLNEEARLQAQREAESLRVYNDHNAELAKAVIDAKDQLLELTQLLEFTKGKVQRQHRKTDDVPESAVREAAEAVAVAAVVQAETLKGETPDEETDDAA